MTEVAGLLQQDATATPVIEPVVCRDLLSPVADSAPAHALRRRASRKFRPGRNPSLEAEIAIASSPLESGQTLFTAYLRDVTTRKRAEQAEVQQRVLLGELNHRVKNNMQMLQSLLGIAARQAGSAEAREVLEEASGRVTAMAAAQRVLYTTPDAKRFDARDFLNTISDSTKQTFPRNLTSTATPIPYSCRTTRRCRSR